MFCLYKKEKSKKEPWRPKHPILRSLRGEKLCIIVTMLKDGKYEVHESWRPLNQATIIKMGFVPAYGFKTGWRDILTKVYIKFVGFRTYPCIRKITVDGKEVEVDATTKLTSSALYDYFTSEAQTDFMKGMKVKQFNSLDWKKMGTAGIVLVGVLCGMYILMGMR